MKAPSIITLSNATSTTPPPPPPPWEVVILVAHHLDPETLAIASCVSKSWYNSMSSTHFWHSFCSTQYPSLSQLRITNPLISYRRLYAMAYTATKRRVKSPSQPELSLDRLTFVINISTKENRNSIISITKQGSELNQHEHMGVFRFDIDVNCNYVDEATEDVNISWIIVADGWREIFSMMDLEGKLRVSHGGEVWFSAELPCPGCCSSDMSSGIVSDLKLTFSNEDGRESDTGKFQVDKVSVGMLNIVNWRYMSLENGLRYLQHYLVRVNSGLNMLNVSDPFKHKINRVIHGLARL